MADIAELFASLPYFTGLDAATLERIASQASRQTYAAGQVVFLEGEPCRGLYVVEQGWLKAVKSSAEGREQIVRLVGPGELFHELGVFTTVPNPASVIALEPTAVWIISRSAMQQLLDERPALARLVIDTLAGRVLYLVGLIEDLSLHSVEARLVRLLLDQATGDVVQRQRWHTQAEMAARLGTVPDVLSRALRSLVEAGLIGVERHQIRILDRPGLERRAQLD